MEKYEENLKKSLKTVPINYDNVSKVLSEFSKTEYFLTNIKDYKPYESEEIDLLIETLAWTMAFESKPVESSLYAQLRVYELYPYLIYNIMFLKTIDQQREYFNKLIDLYQDTYGNFKEDQFWKNAMIYKSYLDNFEENFKNNSSLVNLNYFAGIRFSELNVSFDKLPKNYLMVNIGYKHNLEENSIVSKNLIYGDIKSVEGITLTNKDMEQISFNKIVNVYSRKDCYKIVNNDENSDMYKIVINYNNDKDDKKCLYTISKNEIPKIFVTILTHGGTIYKVRNQTLRVYFSECLTRRYCRIVRNNDLKKSIDDIISKISVLLSERYDKDVDKTIENWKGFNNDEIFDLWLNKLYDFDKFDEETKQHYLDYNDYVCTIKSYFLPIDDYID